MDPILLTEHQPTFAVHLEPGQRDALAGLVRSISIAPHPGSSDVYDLRPGADVGAVVLPGGLEVVISPKIPMARCLFLVSYAMGLRRDWADAVQLDEARDLFEAIVPAFVHHVRRATERGVLQGYRQEEDALPIVRGRWRIGDQLGRRFGIAPPVEVTFDDFTEDIELNRLLRAAVHRLLRIPFRTARWRWALRALDDRLSTVRLVHYPASRIPSPVIDRRTEHYRDALGLARLILAGTSFDTGTGETPASAFLIDMNKVFEEFVVIALRQSLKVNHRTLVQGGAGTGLYLDMDERVSLAPDLSYWDAAGCRFVADVKYKKLDGEDARNADLYQLLSYVIATSVGEGTLIYGEGGEPEPLAVRNVGKTLHVVALNLDVEPEDLLSQVDGLARRLMNAA